jgi:hypothetical protein
MKYLTVAPKNPNRIWKDIPGYEERYSVSNDGFVKRIASGRGARANTILAFNILSIGYAQVTLYPGNGVTRKNSYVHDLVSAAFIGRKPNGYNVNHKDLDKCNNNDWNLEYVTHKENYHHARIHNAYSTKLTERDVAKIRAMEGTLEHIAAQFGVSGTNISYIKRFKSWKFSTPQQ